MPPEGRLKPIEEHRFYGPEWAWIDPVRPNSCRPNCDDTRMRCDALIWWSPQHVRAKKRPPPNGEGRFERLLGHMVDA